MSKHPAVPGRDVMRVGENTGSLSIASKAAMWFTCGPRTNTGLSSPSTKGANSSRERCEA